MTPRPRLIYPASYYRPRRKPVDLQKLVLALSFFGFAIGMLNVPLPFIR